MGRVPFNYQHLLLFRAVVVEGGASAAARRLGLAQATVSEQLKRLETSLGTDLFTRVAGRLVLTDAGVRVSRYAEQIAALGEDLAASLVADEDARAPRLVVGLSDVVPKLVAARLLRAAWRFDERLRIVCVEDDHERLLAQLAIHAVDVVLSDAPAGRSTLVRAYSHDLGGCGVSFVASPATAQRLGSGFPKALHGAPVLMPARGTSLSRDLTRFFERHGVHPQVRGEFADSALMKVLGKEGIGVFAVPTAIESAVRQDYGLVVVGRTEEVRASFFAMTVDRRVRNAAVAAMCRHGRSWLDRAE